MKGIFLLCIILINGGFFISCTKDVGLIVPFDFRDRYVGKYMGIKTQNNGLVDSNYIMEFSKLSSYPSDSIIDSNGNKYLLFEKDGIGHCFNLYYNCYYYKDSMVKYIDYFYGPHGISHYTEKWRLYKK